VCGVIHERVFVPKRTLTWEPMSGRKWSKWDMQKFRIQILYSVMNQCSVIFWKLWIYFGKLFKGLIRYIENCEYNQARVWASLLTEDDLFNL
jgi:hypothetical protein